VLNFNEREQQTGRGEKRIKGKDQQRSGEVLEKNHRHEKILVIEGRRGIKRRRKISIIREESSKAKSQKSKHSHRDSSQRISEKKKKSRTLRVDDAADLKRGTKETKKNGARNRRFVGLGTLGLGRKEGCRH